MGGQKGSTYHRLERVVKGFSNHRRIQILDLLQKEPELSVDDIASRLKINFKTASEHIRRMAIAGLLLKRSDGTHIRHKLTDAGVSILKFLHALRLVLRSFNEGGSS